MRPQDRSCYSPGFFKCKRGKKKSGTKNQARMACALTIKKLVNFGRECTEPKKVLPIYFLR